MSLYGNYLQCFHLKVMTNAVLLGDILTPEVCPLR